MSPSGYNRPQRRRNVRRVIAIALIISSLLVLLADRQQRQMLASGRLAADSVSARVMGVISAPKRGIEKLFTNMEERQNAFRDNKRLRQEVERLRPFENQVLDLQMRLGRFEKMLGVQAGPDFSQTKILGRAVTETRGPFVHSALLNIGANKGVKREYAVMTSRGLYGHIVRVGRHSSRVLLLNDLNSRIPVMSQRSGARAILIGKNGTRPTLSYIAPDADWKTGDRVVTSGDGGIFPQGLAVGVVELDRDREWSVKLFSLETPIDWVWVYPFTPILPPEQDVAGDVKSMQEQKDNSAPQSVKQR